MGDVVESNVVYHDKDATLVLQVPELDVEHESALRLEVLTKECIFTAPPYHARISVDQPLKPGEAFPDSIDYEKSTVTYKLALAPANNPECQGSTVPTYPFGFNRMYQGPLNIETSQDLKVLPNPERLSPAERFAKCQETERQNFNAEHYGTDHIQFLIDEFNISLEPPAIKVHLSDEQRYLVRIVTQEKQRVKDLYCSVDDKASLMFSLLDILLATVYDKITNGNELNEANSYFNIHRISATLSYFVEFTSAEDVLRSFYRRSCIYPYYRHKNIAKRCTESLVDGLRGDGCRNWVLEKLLHAYSAFKVTDCVILNHYFIKDYIRYIEWAFGEDAFTTLAQTVADILPEVHRETLGFGEDKIVQAYVREMIGVDDCSTDSDDCESTDESDSSVSELEDSDSADEKPLARENVLEALMNLKIK